MSQSPPPPTPAALLYLFADKVIEPDTALSKGFEVPCTQVKVKRAYLATDLFAISFWSLAEDGKIDLSMGKRTMLGMGKPQITATIRPGVAIPEPESTPVDPSQLAAGYLPAGIGNMLKNLAPQIASAQISKALPLSHAILRRAASESLPVRDIVRDWFGSDVSDPHRYVVNHVEQEIVDLGLSTGMAPMTAWSTPKPVVDCDKRAALEGSAGQLLHRWLVFRDDEAGLGPTLRDRCKAAIGSRTESSDD